MQRETAQARRPTTGESSGKGVITATSKPVLQLQSAAGNSAVARLLEREGAGPTAHALAAGAVPVQRVLAPATGSGGRPGAVADTISAQLPQPALQAAGGAAALADLLNGALAATAVQILVRGGYRDENDLANLVFWARNPTVAGQRIAPEQRDLAVNWLDGRDRVVRPALAAAERDAPPDPQPARPTTGGGSAGPGVTPAPAPGGGPVTPPGPPPAVDPGLHWLVRVMATPGLVTVPEAQATVAAAGPLAVQQAMQCREAAQADPDPRRVHLRGRNRAHQLDWDAVHPQVRPANPTGAGAVAAQYGSLRTVFAAHRRDQLTETFGVDDVEYVLSAVEVATSAGRADVAAGLRALLFRANQYAVVETLNVAQSARYQPGGGKTYCNIYAYDVVTALGGYLPRVWWKPAAWAAIQGGAEIVTVEEYRRMARAGESVADVVAPIYGTTVSEMNANALTAWMRSTGAEFGWTQAADVTAAQDAANGGALVILLAANAQASRSGHVSVVLAESAEHQARRDEQGRVVSPLQSQAGSRNFAYSEESGAPGSGGRQWWSDAKHKHGAAWIFSGAVQSPLLTPEDLGARPEP